MRRGSHLALTNALVLYVLGHAGKRLNQHRLDTAATAICLAATDHDVQMAWHQGLVEGRFQFDSDLVAELWASAPRRIKLLLLADGCLGYLEPKRFRTVFLDATRLRGLEKLQRRDLISMLMAFLRRHPEQIAHYEPYILGFLRSRRHIERLFALPMMGWLDRISRGDLEIMLSCLSAEFDLQMHALNAFCELLQRYRSVAPEALAFCSSEEVASAARRIYRKPADKYVRLCAYYYLKALKSFRARRRSGVPQRQSQSRWRSGRSTCGARRRTRRASTSRGP